MFHVFFNSLARSKYLSLSLFLFSLIFTLWSARVAKFTIQEVKFSFYFFIFLFFSLLQGLVFWPGLGNLFVSQNPREFCGFCIYHLSALSNFNLFHNSKWVIYYYYYYWIINFIVVILQHFTGPLPKVVSEWNKQL